MHGKKFKSGEKVREGEQETNSSPTIYDLFLRINVIQPIPVALRVEYMSITAMDGFGKMLVLLVTVKIGYINPMSPFLII